MKERPILFSGPMVRAIQAGTKTQTRRIIKGKGIWSVHHNEESDVWWPGQEDESGDWIHFRCPYGDVGDRLWVRETWTPDHAAFYPNFPIVYRADRGFDYERNSEGKVYSPEQKSWYPYRWRPSIHMPRIAARLLLEITGVRVERLRDITPEDAIAEGIESRPATYAAKLKEWKCYGWLEKHNQWTSCPVVSYETLWESINGEGSWAANPWVWVIEFKKVEAA